MLICKRKRKKREKGVNYLIKVTEYNEKMFVVLVILILDFFLYAHNIFSFKHLDHG